MLAGKSAVITGSTSGIGLGIAWALAGAGANVMINGLGDTHRISELRSELKSEFDVKVIYHNADMLKSDQIRDMIDCAGEYFGAVDILVNNAGIQHVSPIEEFPDEKWNDVIGINLSAAFHSIKATLPDMRTRGYGRIINIASAHGLVASPYKAAYVAAKHGLVGLTKTIALEAAEHGITVNAICPGYVLTPLVKKQIPDTARARGITEDEVKRDVLLSAQPTKKFVTTQQVGALAVFLCTDAAQQITGAALPIDGGWVAQ